MREIGRLLDSADLLPFLKYRDDQCLFQKKKKKKKKKKGIRPRSSEACMMRVTAGATSAISRYTFGACCFVRLKVTKYSLVT